MAHACAFVSVILLALCAFRTDASAQTVTWTDADRNELWSDSGNWSWSNGASGVPGVDCTACDVVLPSLFSGNFTTDSVSALTVNNVTVSPNAVVVMKDNTTLTVNGSALSGYIEMSNSGIGGARTTLTINGNVTYTDGLQGLGIQMFDHSLIIGSGTLNNNGTITYGLSVAGTQPGFIAGVNLNNLGTIDSSGTNSILFLMPTASWTNSGTIEAQAGGRVTIERGAITQQGSGQLLANAGTVFLQGPSIIGGTLASASGGTLLTYNSNPVLTNLTLSGEFLVGLNSLNSGSLTLAGTITNNGLIELVGNSASKLLINSNVTLIGTGSGVAMGDGGSTISGSGTLTSQQTISGPGTISVAGLVNQGTISAVTANGATTLTLKPGSLGVTNTGTIQAALGGSTMEISGGSVTNTGGTIASGPGIALLDGGVTITGGTVSGNNGSFVEGKSVTLDGTASPVSITGVFDVLSGDETDLKGTINGAGNIFVEGSTGDAVVHVKGTTLIAGGTGVVLSNDTPNSQMTGDGSTLSKITFQGSTLEGNGVVSGVKVTIDATSALECLLNATPLEFDATSSALIQGTLSNPTGCVIKFDSNLLNVNPSTGTLTGGTFNLTGPLQQPSNIQALNGSVTLNTPAAELETLSGGNALTPLATIGSKGALTLGSTVVMQTTGALSNAGTLTLNTVSFLDPGGDLTQTKGVASISGTINLPVGGTFTATGGTVEGNNGVFNGNLSVGNQTGGAKVNLNFGPTSALPGQLTVSKNLTFNPTVFVTEPIVGSTVGSGYGAMNVTGTATLSGTFSVTRPTQYVPPLGTVFTVMNASGGVIGTYATVKGLSINQSEHFELDYTTNTVTLTVVSGPLGEGKASSAFLGGGFGGV